MNLVRNHISFREKYLNYLALWYLEVYDNCFEPTQAQIDHTEAAIQQMTSFERTKLMRELQSSRDRLGQLQ